MNLRIAHMKRFFPILIVFTFLSTTGHAENLTVKPGSLARMKSEELSKFVNLTLSGEIDATDLTAIRDNCEALRTLDLSGTKVVESVISHQSNGSSSLSDADILPEGALFGLKIAELRLPTNIKSIEDFALAGTGITSLDIPSSVTRIGNCAFSGSSLQTINLPVSVTNLGDYVFSQCTELQTATILCDNITRLPLGTFMGCKSLETLNSAKIRVLGEKSLSGTSSLSKFNHATLEQVENRALEGSGLKELDAKWVKSTGDYAFAFMPSLEKLDISGYHTEYGKGALAGCPVLTDHTPDGKADMPALIYAASPKVDFSSAEIMTSDIGEYALLNNQSKNLKLGASVRSLADGALQGMTALEKIDATELYDNPPTANDAAFTGIDRKKVILLVGEKTKPVWAAANGWKEFYIQELSGIDNPSADMTGEGGITFRLDSNMLYISAPVELKNIEIYNTAGLRLLSVTPNTIEYVADLSQLSETVIILSIKTTEATRTAKIYL